MRVVVVAALTCVLASGCVASGAGPFFENNPVGNLFTSATNGLFGNNRPKRDRPTTENSANASRSRSQQKSADTTSITTHTKHTAAKKSSRPVKARTAKIPSKTAYAVDCDKNARRITDKLQRQQALLKSDGIGRCQSARIYKTLMLDAADMWKGCRKLDPDGKNFREAAIGAQQADAIIRKSCAKTN